MANIKTIINGKLDRISYNKKGQSELTFLIENRQQNKYVEELKKEVNYKIQISEVKSLRSLQQNKFMWALINELSKRTKEDSFDLYVKLLKSIKAKYEYMAIPEQAIEMLKLSNDFRAIEVIKPVITNEGKKLIGIKVYYGSSKFNVKEMNELLDHLISWCEAENINVEAYRYE